MMFVSQTELLSTADYESLSRSWKETERYELIGGELIMVPPPSTYHQDILTYLVETLGPIVRKKRLGKVYVSPVNVFASEHDVYQPDLLFVRQEHRSIIANDGVHGAPDFVIEILSPSNAYYDLKTKKDIYQQIGVREYWIVDPMDHSVECFVNSDTGFKSVQAAKSTGTVCSEVIPDFCIELVDIFSSN
jgi:Uma2 family endonuclease